VARYPGADAHFADSHSSLATDLIVQMKKAFGDEGLDKLLKLRNADLEKSLSRPDDKAQTLKAKLDALAKIRSAEGYMAEVRREPETGPWLFVENHCPICAARVCAPVCAARNWRCLHRVLGPHQGRAPFPHPRRRWPRALSRDAG